MKKITLFLILSMVIVFSAEAHKYKNRNATITISIQTFYDQLSPYGDWIYTPDYGYVWRPYFDNPESFRPYSSNGNWVYTDYGWTWASGYDWGWATFHYGRWDFDNYLGWMWIPGYEWAPAWVSWGSYDNYWGWAPMGPNIYVQSNWYAPDPWWTFVPQNRFCSSNWNHYIYNRPVRVNHITHITNVYVDGNNHNNRNSWYNGPRVNDVERYSKSKVRRMEVADSQRPDRTGIRNNTLNVYRPSVDNKHKEYRPSEYRNVEQARTGKRIEQTNARTNDPGVNRIRDSRNEVRNTKQVPAERNVNSTRESRVEPRATTQVPNSRKAEVSRSTKEAVRTAPQSEKRNSTSNNRSQVEQRNGSQASPDRNTTRPSVETNRETSDRKSKINVTEGNRPITNTNRVVNTENNKSGKSAPARENVNNNSSRGSKKSQTPAAQPTREQRTQTATPSSNSRSQKTEIKQTTKEEVRQAVNKTSDASREKRASGKPTGR